MYAIYTPIAQESGNLNDPYAVAIKKYQGSRTRTKEVIHNLFVISAARTFQLGPHVRIVLLC